MSKHTDALISSYNKKCNAVTITIPNDGTFKREEKRKSLAMSWNNKCKTDENERIYLDVLMEAVTSNDEENCKVLLETHDPNRILNSSSMYPIQIAAVNGRIGILRNLITAGANLDIQHGKEQSSPLHLTAEKSFNECAQLLISSGANIYLKDSLKNTILHIAASKGNVNLCSSLLEYTRDTDWINSRNSTGHSAMHLAATDGYHATVAMLIQYGAKILVKNNKYLTPLHLAALKGHDKCCELIIIEAEKCKLNIKTITEMKRPTPLILAAKYGHVHCCELLIKYADINHVDNLGNTALHYASLNRFLHTIRFLLFNGANQFKKNDAKNSSIHIAAGLCNEACLHALVGSIQESPRFNNKNQSVLHIAAQLDQTENLNLLVNNYVFSDEINHKDKNGNAPLHDAITKGNDNAYSILVDAGADLSLTDINNNSPLHLAARSGRLHMVKLLLKGDLIKIINSQNKNGATPLHLAAFINSVPCCYHLCYRGAKISIKDDSGKTPLLIAANEGHSDIVSFLIKNGARPHMTLQNTGNNPLHIAASMGHDLCCKILVKFAPKLLNKENVDGRTPLDLAFLNNQDHIFPILLSKEEECNRLNIKKKEFRLKIHQMMHTAIDGNRRPIQETIIDSNLWFDGLDAALCHQQPCKNFRMILEKNSSLAEKVLDKCTEEMLGKTSFNFRLFEDIYRVKSSNECRLVEPYQTDKEMPFNEHGNLLKNAHELPDYNWARDHPLGIAIQNQNLNILQHKLTLAYLRHYWKSYVGYVFFFMLFYEIISVICQISSLIYCRNWYNILSQSNATKSDICSTEESALPQLSAKAGFVSVILLMFVLFGHILFELNFLIKVPKIYLRPSTCLRISRIMGLICFCLPASRCSNVELLFGIKEDWQWQLGILIMLVSWFLMVHHLNNLPIMSVFMPITGKFISSFVRVLFYIIIIILVFSIIFHFLLGGQVAFLNIYRSFIKTTVWLLGDLGYDDTFLEDDALVPYPILSNVIFIIFVTSISGFIINLIISQPSSHLDELKEQATLTKASGHAILLLDIGSSFRRLRRRCCVSFIVNYYTPLADFPGLLSWDDTALPRKPYFNVEKSLLHISDILRAQSEQIFELKTQLEQIQSQLTIFDETPKRMG